jgi:hypothetical protein
MKSAIAAMISPTQPKPFAPLKIAKIARIVAMRATKGAM